ncbi:MAG: dynamin family protein [Fibromonadales bacterium]|nr:dynamin family protein [Fibromonadales bacterium]
MANVFENINSKKGNLLKIAEKAAEFAWISEEQRKEITDKINSDKLTLGVIGQMKAGKSTFLNAFVFEDAILPWAATPMTATLSRIVFGEQEKIEAEFYTKEEWSELKNQSEQNLENVNDSSLEQTIKDLRKQVGNAEKLGSELNDLLGTKKQDELKNLIEYVGANGKYTPVTKSVTIYSSKPYLKGVEIVDTPGFNDPVVSREKRTRDFLKEADVVVLMLYAGRAFDSTDRDIIFKYIREVGIGKILIAMNKYDVNVKEGMSEKDEEEIRKSIKRIKEEIKKDCKKYGDDTISELLNNVEPIPLSTSMALMAKTAKLSMEKINNSEKYKYDWDRMSRLFGISSPDEMLRDSKIADLENAVLNIVLDSKEEILFEKSKHVILTKGNNKITKNIDETKICQQILNDSEKPDNEIEENITKYKKSQKKIERIIGKLENNLAEQLEEKAKKIRRDIESTTDSTENKINSIINTLGKFGNPITEVKKEIRLLQRNIRDESVDGVSKIKLLFENDVNTSLGEIDSIFRDIIDDDEYLAEKFHKLTKRLTDIMRIDKEGYSIPESNVDWSWYNRKIHMKEEIGVYFSELKFDKLEEKLKEVIKNSISELNSGFLDNLLAPIIPKLEALLGSKEKKEQAIAENKAKLIELKAEKKKLEEQKKEIENMISNLG